MLILYIPGIKYQNKCKGLRYPSIRTNEWFGYLIIVTREVQMCNDLMEIRHPHYASFVIIRSRLTHIQFEGVHIMKLSGKPEM